MAGFGDRVPAESVAHYADTGADIAACHGSTPLPVSTGPWHWVVAAIVTAVVGLGLGIAAPLFATATDSRWALMVFSGWVLAGVVTFVLVGVHTISDTRRQAAGPYLSTPAQRWVYRSAIIVGLSGVGLTAIEIAMWAAKIGVL